MIVYSATKGKFHEDVDSNNIGNIILGAFETATHHRTSRSEVDSWTNSLQYMDRVLNDSEIPRDIGVSIEYHIPNTTKRIDLILTGLDGQNNDTAVLVELKQWSTASMTNKDAIVVTWLGNGLVERPHPSYQAWTYKRLLEDFNQTVQDDAIRLFPCAYLHNYEPDAVIENPFYAQWISEAPLFLKDDAAKLRQFIKAHIKYGDKKRLMYRIDEGKIRPSKSLADQLASMLKGNVEFVMVDDQKVVYEMALSLLARSTGGKKQVLIVEGGPGTGKSVVAINLLVALTGRGLVAQYVTKNSAPRRVYEEMLTGTFRRTHISNMFTSSGKYHACEPAEIDYLIVDEAHRLNAKSGMFSNLGENQVKEIIRASKCSVFFVDEDQKVTLKDIGDKEEIRRWATAEDAEITEQELISQFRCNGSNNYIAWLDDTLQIKETANGKLDTMEYDFRVMDSPEAVFSVIREKNKVRNKARMVAGYCWNWVSKKEPARSDIRIGEFTAKWNLSEDGQSWIIQPNSVDQIGCIHTCQGLELEYVGVIIGPDLIVRNGLVVTNPAERARTDKSLHGWRKLTKENPSTAMARFDAIIKNTYRTLMTRGQKGCFVYCTDAETRQYLKSRTEKAPERIVPFENALPLLELRSVANATYQTLDGTFPDGETIVWFRVAGGPFARDCFLVRAEGDSMEPEIANGDLCVFSKERGGSRNGKIVLCQIDGYAGEAPVALIKCYRSARMRAADSIGEAKTIVLSSTNAKHEDVVLSEGENLRIVGIFNRVVHQN